MLFFVYRLRNPGKTVVKVEQKRRTHFESTNFAPDLPIFVMLILGPEN